ncbi:hypothetical protein P7K49_028988, partial [Saguinus oedipus]
MGLNVEAEKWEHTQLLKEDKTQVITCDTNKVELQDPEVLPGIWKKPMQWQCSELEDAQGLLRPANMGCVRTKTMKKAARVITEKYYTLLGKTSSSGLEITEVDSDTKEMDFGSLTNLQVTQPTVGMNLKMPWGPEEKARLEKSVALESPRVWTCLVDGEGEAEGQVVNIWHSSCDRDLTFQREAAFPSAIAIESAQNAVVQLAERQPLDSGRDGKPLRGKFGEKDEIQKRPDGSEGRTEAARGDLSLEEDSWQGGRSTPYAGGVDSPEPHQPTSRSSEHFNVHNVRRAQGQQLGQEVLMKPMVAPRSTAFLVLGGVSTLSLPLGSLLESAIIYVDDGIVNGKILPTK